MTLRLYHKIPIASWRSEASLPSGPLGVANNGSDIFLF